MKWVIGIDEAGRGPLAGPVSIGVAIVPSGFDWEQIPGVNDSKKLTEQKREVIFERALELKKEGKLDYSVVMPSAKKVDADGIVPCITAGIKKGLEALRARTDLAPEECGVRLDGGLKAPAEYVHQETIIKGDAKEKIIGLASIMAKVTRDRYMVDISALPEFASYMFETHKGYGTKKHREAIAQNGLSSEHRESYCGNIVML